MLSDPKAIADAVIGIFKDPQKKSAMEKNTYNFGRQMIWYNIALQHLSLFDEVLTVRIVWKKN